MYAPERTRSNDRGRQDKLRRGAFGFLLLCLLGVSDSVNGATIWTVEEGGKGHSYSLTSQRGSWLAVEEEEKGDSHEWR
jgi:hypothetical protein